MISLSTTIITGSYLLHESLPLIHRVGQLRKGVGMLSPDHKPTDNEE